MVPLFVLILIAAVLWRQRHRPTAKRLFVATLPRESASDKAAAPDATTMTERPAISSAVFSLWHRHNLRTAATPLCFRLLPVVVNSVRRSSKSPSKIWCCNDATRGQSARRGSRVWTQT